MSQKCAKKLVLLNTFYYRSRTQDGKILYNFTNYVTNPLTSSDSSIFRMTDKYYIPIKNEFIQYNAIVIPPNNPISGIIDQTFQVTVMIKTKCGFVSANTFYFDKSSTIFTTNSSIDYPATASSGNLKNAVLVRIDYDNDGNKFSNGVKFARRVKVYGYK
jgi:hypothetical protein